MKLQNKKTGGLATLVENEDCLTLKTDAGFHHYFSLAQLNKEWEDYEEPKYFWYIDDFMIMCGTEGEFTTPDLASFTKKDIEKLKAIGNYFETKEEAEKAVEKLKAWKRLKDKGFRFTGWTIDDGLRISICSNIDEEDIYDEDKRKIKPDLDLLFGGEE